MADELDQYLRALPDQLREQVSDVVREQAQILSDAQRAALRSLEQSPEETGDLEASCTVTSGSNDLECIVQAGGDATTRDGYDYGAAFEYGTSRQPARPFFWDTYEAMRDDIETNISDAISEALK